MEISDIEYHSPNHVGPIDFNPAILQIPGDADLYGDLHPWRAGGSSQDARLVTNVIVSYADGHIQNFPVGSKIYKRTVGGESWIELASTVEGEPVPAENVAAVGGRRRRHTRRRHTRRRQSRRNRRNNRK